MGCRVGILLMIRGIEIGVGYEGRFWVGRGGEVLIILLCVSPTLIPCGCRFLDLGGSGELESKAGWWDE